MTRHRGKRRGLFLTLLFIRSASSIYFHHSYEYHHRAVVDFDQFSKIKRPNTRFRNSLVFSSQFSFVESRTGRLSKTFVLFFPFDPSFGCSIVCFSFFSVFCFSPFNFLVCRTECLKPRCASTAAPPDHDKDVASGRQVPDEKVDVASRRVASADQTRRE